MAGICRVFCPWGEGRAINSLPKVPQEGDCSLPVHPRCRHHAMHSGASSLLPRNSYQGSSLQRKSQISKTSEFELQKLLKQELGKLSTSKTSKFELQKLFAKKNRDTQYFLLPSSWCREVFLFANLILHYLRASLSLLSFRGNVSLPSAVPPSFSPQFTSTHLAPFKLSSSSLGDLSADQCLELSK